MLDTTCKYNIISKTFNMDIDTPSQMVDAMFLDLWDAFICYRGDQAAPTIKTLLVARELS